MDKKIPDINKTPQPNPMNFVTPNQDYLPEDASLLPIHKLTLPAKEFSSILMSLPVFGVSKHAPALA
jgi:hypothetical protein